jgi:hypothetical protein
MVLARPSEHHHDHEDRQARVEEHVADRDHGADGRRDPDHIRERREHVVRSHEVMLHGARADEPVGAGTGRFEGARAHGHPIVHADHQEVQGQTRDHQPRGG